MQNAGIAAMGLDWTYVACEVAPEQLREALTGAAAMRFLGVNLTVPHKLLALEMMDVLDESARRWGAVNTVRFEGRTSDGPWDRLGNLPPDAVVKVRMQGFNTDAEAIVRSLREDLGMELEGRTALLLGAGGAGRVAGLRLAHAGLACLWLVNRTEARAAALAGDIRQQRGAEGTRVEVGYPDAPVDLVLNATSAGLKPDDPLPYDPRRLNLRKVRAVYDMIYRPAETPFLTAARAAGCRAANGLGMLLHQGVAALELWCGRAAPIEVMRRALQNNVYGMSS